ncbi:MAG: hypothetical protein U1G07_15715 [Verrucomicrobiota bacterium]
MPHGLETQVGERAPPCPSASDNRFALPAPLLADPRIVALIDMTSAIDTVTEARLHGLKSCRGGRHFVVAHRLSTIRKADLVLVLDQGPHCGARHCSDSYWPRGVYARLHHEFVGGTQAGH